MLGFLCKRVLQMFVVVFLALTAVFFLVRLSGDPTALFLPPDAPREQLEYYRSQLGFDRPLYVQYGEFIVNAIQGDFGKSLVAREDALGLVLERLPATFQLALFAMGVALLISIPIGILSAYRRNSLFDQLGVTLTVIGQAVPNFWLGLILIYFFGVIMQWLPTGGGGSVTHMILPTLTLAGYSIARFTRFTRSTMIDVYNEDYIRTAKASGASMLKILSWYGLKNASIPLITLVALDLGVLLGGSVITEVVFSWPGIGKLLMQSLLSRDFPVVMATIFLISVIYSVVNFLADLLYALVNPQIRYR
ncbi:ABC transporter permease [Brevibacillus choshinensis]|uniref:ABC transporter permease n=1 Tax=Brevibacillus choshinensis TaxID=54911 RepID=A0ABR5NEL7_BRECH|nr:ABC transporter permease [Brevibacillus choshinensis]KQL49974.1 ABC transporter permease [Brevibacillus choshinensis]